MLYIDRLPVDLHLDRPESGPLRHEHCELPEGGLEVQHRMASFTDKVAVIAITADDSPETRVRWLSGGALACLRKPIGVDEVLALATKVIEWQTRSRVA